MKKIILFSFVFFLSLTLVVAFGPSLPHQFYGDVEYNGAPADNLVINAYIDGVIVGSAIVSDGRYGVSPLFLIKDFEESYSGKTINFFLNGINTGRTAVFENGGSIELNLSATGPAINSPPGDDGGSGGSGGGGGGSGGSGGSPQSQDALNSSFEGNVTSSNDDSVKTFEEEESGEEIFKTANEEVKPNRFLALITGATIGVADSNSKKAVWILIIIVIGSIIYVKFRKKGKETGEKVNIEKVVKKE